MWLQVVLIHPRLQLKLHPSLPLCFIYPFNFLPEHWTRLLSILIIFTTFFTLYSVKCHIAIIIYAPYHTYSQHDCFTLAKAPMITTHTPVAHPSSWFHYMTALSYRSYCLSPPPRDTLPFGAVEMHQRQETEPNWRRSLNFCLCIAFFSVILFIYIYFSALFLTSSVPSIWHFIT